MKSGRMEKIRFPRRSPWPAFWMSFFFTGLGQVYNDDFIRGLALFLLKIIFIIYAVLSVSLDIYDSLLYPVIFSTVLALGIKVYSVIDAAMVAVKNRSSAGIPFSRKMLLVLFAIITSLLLVFFLWTYARYLRIITVTDDMMEPSLHRGDICLAAARKLPVLKTGDIVMPAEYFSRIITDIPSVFEIKDGRVWVNGEEADIGVPEKDTKTESVEHLYYEKFMNVSYFIFLTVKDPGDNVSYRKIMTAEGEIGIVNDNRMNPHPEKASGTRIFRLEGVIFSRDRSNILRTDFTFKKD